MRKIPKKNYIIYLVIIFITAVICVYTITLYNQSKKYYQNNSVLTDVVVEIVLKKELDIQTNLNNYLTENSELIIYVSSGKDEKIKDFENQFKNMILEKKLQKGIIYINSDNINYFEFMEGLQSTYSDLNKQLVNKPTIIVFEQSKIKDIYNDSEPIVNSVKWFLIENGVIEND